MIEGQPNFPSQINQIDQDTESLEVNGEWTEGTSVDRHIPSYVGLSCAVSGYRSINKYDAAIREGFCARNSPTRIALSRGYDKGPPISSDRAKNEDLSHKITNCGTCVAPRNNQLHFRTSKKDKMDSPRGNMNGHPSVHCSQVVKIERYTTVESSTTPLLSEESLVHFGNGTSKEESGKSFVQQRIERLYGPAALGMAFQAKRAMLERYKEREKERREDSQNHESVRDPPQGLPRVFRHLRPEFRYQLPVKPRSGFSLRSRNNFETEELESSYTNNGVTNGHRVRHIPIEIEDDDDDVQSSQDTEDKSKRSWKTLSRDLQAVNTESNSKTATNKTQKVITTDLKTLDLNKNINSNSAEEERFLTTDQEVKDGHYFLKIVATELSFLKPQVEKIEDDLKASGEAMSEEIRGKLLAASGKAKLLLNQKIEQFKGLCQKNISKSTTEEFPTTNEDLAGFWDMVNIQVENVKDMLKEVDLLRNNNWKEIPKATQPETVKKPLHRKIKSGASSVGSGLKKSVKDEAKQKANEERRRQMREALNAKRKQANKLKNLNKEAEEVEIFIADK